MSTNLLALLPELILTVTAVLVMVARARASLAGQTRKPLGWLAILGTSSSPASQPSGTSCIIVDHARWAVTSPPSTPPSRSTPSPSSSICSSPPSSLVTLLGSVSTTSRTAPSPTQASTSRWSCFGATGMMFMTSSVELSDGLHRSRNLLDLHLHPRRLPQGPRHRIRVLHQVLPARQLCDGILPLRRCTQLRCHRLHQHWRHRRRPRHYQNTAPSALAGCRLWFSSG